MPTINICAASANAKRLIKSFNLPSIILRSVLSVKTLNLSQVPGFVGMTCSLLAAMVAAGCGGAGQTSSAPQGQAPTITQQPASLTVPIGRAATFTVSAEGDQPITYQWSENGVDLPGATGSSYTTPVIGSLNQGSTSIGSFQVTVKNASGSVVSSAATLTAGPRAPAIGDMRYLLFEQVTAPGLGNYGGESGSLNAGLSLDSTSNSASNAVGTPLVLGSSDACNSTNCGWRYTWLFLPPMPYSFNMYYTSGGYADFVADFQSEIHSNSVVTSLDLEPSVQVYAMSYVQSTQPGAFLSSLEVVAPDDLQTQAAKDAANGRIITAASFDATGKAYLISCDWTQDTSTVYEATTAIVTPQNIASTVVNFAAQGYVITAFGGNDTNGYILIGIRVKGDSLPRPLEITTGSTTAPATNPDNAYFTTVVYFGENNYLILSEQ